MFHDIDQSIIPQDDANEQLCYGTLEQILESARNPKGPIINGLSFPLPLSAIEKSPMSSEIEAWLLAEGINNEQYPSASMRWGLCSTAGARHWIHLDSDGLGTFIDVRVGGKWWFLFALLDENGYSHFFSVRDFLVDFDIYTAPSKFHLEAVYLTPGIRL